MRYEPKPQAILETERAFIAPGWAKAPPTYRPAPETLATMRADAAAADVQNQAETARFQVRKAEAVAAIAPFLSERGKRALVDKLACIARPGWMQRLDAMIGRWDAEEKVRADRRAALARDEARIALAVRAVDWLRARGKEPGRDYEAGQAIDVANDLAAEEEQKRLVAGGRVDFCGSDYCEGCDGWDGESRRCDCGNRRVNWTRHDHHTFETPAVYAEAN